MAENQKNVDLVSAEMISAFEIKQPLEAVRINDCVPPSSRRSFAKILIDRQKLLVWFWNRKLPVGKRLKIGCSGIATTVLIANMSTAV